jgi:hypothetical protein
MKYHPQSSKCPVCLKTFPGREEYIQHGQEVLPGEIWNLVEPRDMYYEVKEGMSLRGSNELEDEEQGQQQNKRSYAHDVTLGMGGWAGLFNASQAQDTLPDISSQSK